MKLQSAALRSRAATRRGSYKAFLSLCALGLLLAGCATEVGHYTLLGKSYPARPANSHVEVYTNGLPTKPFDRVAILDVRCEAQGFMTPNLKNDGLPMLIKQAQAAGCDAIIEIVERAPQANWTLETKVKQYSGVGVVYK